MWIKKYFLFRWTRKPCRLDIIWKCGIYLSYLSIIDIIWKCGVYLSYLSIIDHQLSSFVHGESVIFFHPNFVVLSKWFREVLVIYFFRNFKFLFLAAQRLAIKFFCVCVQLRKLYCRLSWGFFCVSFSTPFRARLAKVCR